METIYIESRHFTCDGYYKPDYDKVLIEDGKPIKYLHWQKNESKWGLEAAVIEEDKSIRDILAATEPVLFENGWIYRVMSPLEALVVFGREEE